MEDNVTLPTSFVRPDYHGGGTVNLSESVLRHFGAADANMVGLRPDILPPELLAGVDVVVMLIVDGFGYLQVQEQMAAGNTPNLARLLEDYPSVFRPITTTLPSMTSCALTTLHTAVPPAQHGLIGWNLYLEEEGAIVDTLKFAPAEQPRSGEIESVNADSFIPVPTIYQRLKRVGVAASVVNYDFFRNTFLTRIIHAGADYHGFATSTDLCINMRQLANGSDGAAFISGYWDKVDTLSHFYGSNSEFMAAEIAALDFMLGRELLDKINRPNVALIITADHGQITTPYEHIVVSNEDGQLYSLLAQPPSGDSRTIYLHAKPGLADKLLNYVQAKYGHIATALTSAQFIAANFLGGPVANPRWRSRLGDVVLLMHDNWRIRTFYHADQLKSNPLIGMHGGLTAHEMYSTLIVARLS